jgi:hypothetical protein
MLLYWSHEYGRHYFNKYNGITLLMVSLNLNSMTTCFDQKFGHLQGNLLHKKEKLWLG